MYPAIPTLQPNPTTGVPAKLDISELSDIFNELHALGFRVVAKRRTAKFPVQKWQSVKRQDLTYTHQMQIQEQSNASGWNVICGAVSGGLVVVDLDFQSIKGGENDPAEVYRYIQSLSPTNFVVSTPTGGLHLYYMADGIRSSTDVGYKGIDIRGEGGLVASLGGFNRYSDDFTHKGVVENHEGQYKKLPDGRYGEVPQMSDSLLEWLASSLRTRDDKPKKGSHFGSDDMVRNYEHTEDGNKRLDEHFKQTIDLREQVVIECLNIIFDEWGYFDNDEWTQIWMSAFHGAPTMKVLNAITEHDNVTWKSALDREEFRIRWRKHALKEGYTVASLFWIARKAGWLAKTGYEIPDRSVEEINVRYISEWLATEKEIPKRILIESQTGSGKTRAIKEVWERSGKPKTVIFVPTIKLATELFHTLLKQGMPATLYRDELKGKPIEVEEMKDAHILVTTLQTFATRIYSAGVDMRHYGLVYIEEIDQLLSGFARGGGGVYVSHVTETQARLGFATLTEAYESSDVVWGVDATMSQVSLAMATRISLGAVKVIRNVQITPKPTVTFVDSYNSAYQVAYEALKKKKTVVFIADTLNKAHEAHELMIALRVVKPAETIILTRRTHAKSEVIDFMKDVEAGAKKYRLVVYNSIMGSGVSIAGCTPDVTVQTAHYLTPRNNLQMLNRYRSQNEVYCYFQRGESLYTHTAESILEQASKRVDIEAGLINIPVTARTETAILRDSLATISIADEKAQRRSPVMMYQSLLEGDGRHVATDDVMMSGVMEHTIKKVRAIQREKNTFISANWHTVRVVDEEDPPTSDMSDMEVALGLQHGVIYRALNKKIPDTEEFDPTYISTVVHSLRKYSYSLTEFMAQDRALSRAERFVLDGDKPLISVSSNMTQVKAVSMLSVLYKDMRVPVPQNEVDLHAEEFVERVKENSDLFDALTNRSRDKFEMLYEPDDIEGTAITLANRLLKRIGMKQKKKRVRKVGVAYRLEISNLKEIEDFMRWRNHSNPDFELTYSFDGGEMEGKMAERIQSAETFRQLTAKQQKQVTQMIVTEGHSFARAVENISEGLVM